MGVTNYHSVNGMLLGETRPGGGRVHYLTDAIGSVLATMNDEGVVLNTYRYKPFGELLAKTGTDPDPRFLWTGTTGSRVTGLKFADQYNRARHYGTRQAQWTTPDPLWPMEKPYAYVNGNPTTWVDRSGSRPEWPFVPVPGPPFLPLPLPGSPTSPLPPDPFDPLTHALCDMLHIDVPSWPDYGIASCYNGENRNCCTACGICFSYDQECSSGVAALRDSGYECGDILACCTKKTCVTVTVTDTGRGRPGRTVDFGCCFAIKHGIMDSPGLVPIACRKIGHRRISRVCWEHSGKLGCPGKKGKNCK